MSEGTLHGRFRDVAQRCSEKIAVRNGAICLTYAELDRLSEEAAVGLMERGVAPGTLVGVSAARDHATVVAILAVMKAGCAYVPLDPTYPRSRLELMVEDAQLGLVVASAEEEPPLPAGVELVDLDGLRSGNARQAPTQGECAYVIYTSGSTGAPKGVCVTHDNVLSLVDACESLFEFTADDVWTLFHSFSFDVSVWEMWGALLHGATLVIVGDEAARSPKTLLELIASEQVTVFGQVPSIFRHLANEYVAHPTTLALRYLIFAGEPLDTAALRAWLGNSETPPKAINMYGITESTIHSSFKELAGADLDRCDSRTPIGIPLPHLRFALIDEEGRSVPDGEIGEIYVSGRGVAAGYWRRPELTNERFVVRNGERFYRSGDLAVRRADGEYDFVGRSDSQVKVRGFRIELGEIEAALRSHPSIETAVAVIHESRRGDRSIVAAVSYRDPETPLPTMELRSYLREQLPAYMVPSRFSEFDRLPLSPTGKLDRREVARLLAEPVEAK